MININYYSMPRRFTDDSLTLRTVFDMTYQTHKNRFDFKDRDVLKGVKIEEITSLSVDRLDVPMKKFRITTFSYPQYKPYVDIRTRGARKQRKVKHQYDIVLELEELSFDSRFFWRVGSQRKWPTKAQIPQKKIKSIRRETMRRWKERYPDKKKLQKIIKKHKKSAPYLDEGDYISQEYGLNGDFYWRISPILADRGMLFGLNWNTDLPEGGEDIFFDKHTIRALLHLLKTNQITK